MFLHVVHAGKVADPLEGHPMTDAQAERYCLLYFEALGSKEEAIFFHADQVSDGHRHTSLWH
jgi:hypothetical protein